MGRYDNIDWERLRKVLHLAARRAVQGWPPSFDCGISAQDLVQDTLLAFWDSESALGWKASKGSLEAFLAAVLKNKAIDHFRRQGFVAGSFDDTDNKFGEMPAHDATDAEAQVASAWRAVEKLVQGDKDLQDLVAAAQLRPGGPNVNKEMAELMGKTPAQVSKLKIRLLTVPGVKGILHGARELTKAKTQP